MDDVTQRDREADFETLIASAYNTGYHDGGIDTLEDGHHPDSAAEGLAQWKADNAGLIEAHRSADAARIAELEKAILAMKNAQHREEEDYRKAELFALLGGQS